MPRPSNTQERRQQITEGLLSVMAKRGYEGATIPAIARAAKLAPGLVHYHFPHKQAILLALVDNLAGKVRSRLDRLLAATGTDPRAQLSAFIEAYVGKGEDADPAAVACWVSIGSEAVRQPEVREAYQRAVRDQLAVLEHLVSAVLASEGRSTQRRREIALGVLSAIEGAYRLIVAAPEQIHAGFAAPTLWRMAEGLVSAEPQGGRP